MINNHTLFEYWNLNFICQPKADPPGAEYWLFMIGYYFPYDILLPYVLFSHE